MDHEALALSASAAVRCCTSQPFLAGCRSSLLVVLPLGQALTDAAVTAAHHRVY